MQQQQGNWKPYNVKAILNNVELIYKTNNITKLNKPTYQFISLLSGFIAHYDLYGFQNYYEDVRQLAEELSCDFFLSDATRDETDSDFAKWYGYEYNHSKAEIKRGLVKLSRQYLPSLQEKGKSDDQDKIALLKECIKRAENDAEFARELTAKLL